MIFPIKVLADHRLRDPGDPGHRRGAAPQRRRRRPSCASTSRARARRASTTTVQLILDGEIDLVVNTPHGSTGGGSARLDGYEIRTAAVLANIPCITTVQGLGAAVQGIEALRAATSGCGRCRTGSASAA